MPEGTQITEQAMGVVNLRVDDAYSDFFKTDTWV